jgi:four helix bundle protein
MGVKRLEDLVAYRLAREFKCEVYRLANGSARAMADGRFRDQLFSSASSVEACMGEGFHRFRAAEFAQFVRYALASLKEAELRLTDGVDRGHFPGGSTAAALNLAKRCRVASLRLHASLQGVSNSKSASPRHTGGPRRRPES